MPGRQTDGKSLDHEQRQGYLQLERRLVSAVEELSEGVRRAAVLSQLDGRTQAAEVLRAAELLMRLLDACITIEITLARRGTQQVGPLAWPRLAPAARVTDEALRRRLRPTVRAADVSADIANGRKLSNEGQRVATRLRQLLPSTPDSKTPSHLAGSVVLRCIESLRSSVDALRKAGEGRLPDHDQETLAVLYVCFDCYAVARGLRQASVALCRSAVPDLSWTAVGEASSLRSRQTAFARYSALDDADAISQLQNACEQLTEVNDASAAALIEATTTGRSSLLEAKAQAVKTRRMHARRTGGVRMPRDRSQAWKELDKEPDVVAWKIDLAERGLLPAGSEYYDPNDPNDGPR